MILTVHQSKHYNCEKNDSMVHLLTFNETSHRLTQIDTDLLSQYPCYLRESVAKILRFLLLNAVSLFFPHDDDGAAEGFCY
jgi:hypothetical protein